MKRLLATTLALLALAGCGGDDSSEPDGGGADQPLAAKLDPATRAAAVVDLDAVRKALGLPEDAEPKDERALVFTAGLAIGPLQTPAATPVGDAIDFGQVSAAAGGSLSSPTAVNILEVSQPFEEIAKALEADGYEEKDGELVTDRPVTAVGASAVAGADGLIALAATPGQAKAALERDTAATDLSRALDLVEGPVRGAATASSQSCLVAYAASDEVKPQGGEIVVKAKEDVSAARFGLDDDTQTFGPTVEFEDPNADGGELRVRWSASARPPVTPVGYAFGDFTLDDFYRCG